MEVARNVTGCLGTLVVNGGALWLNQLRTGKPSAATLTFSGGTLGGRGGNATWSSNVTLTNAPGTGLLTLYAGDQSGAAGMNTFSGLISGQGAITVAAAPGQATPGSVVLSANNTYSGATTLSGTNTLQLGAGSTTGWLPGSLVLTGGGSLAFGRSDTITNNLSVSGTGGSIIQNGSGMLVLTNTAPTFSTAVVNAGVLRFSDALAIPGVGASVTINSGGAVAADGAYCTVTGWLNSGRFVTSSAGSLALAGNSSEAIDLTSAGGGLYSSLSLGAVDTCSYTGVLTPIGNTYRLGGGGGTLSIASAITNGNVVIGGSSGTVVLAASNTFSGGITVNSGTLRVGDPNGMGSGLLTVSGGVLQVNTNLQAGILVKNTGMVQVGAGGTITGLITNNALSVTTGTTAGVAFNGNGVFTHTGDVAGSGELAVIGGGKLNLNTPGQTISQSELWVGNNGSAGNLELSAGTLNATNWIFVARGIQSGPTPSSTLTLSGGTLNKSGANATYVGDVNSSVGTLILTNAAVFNAAGGNVGISTGNGTGTMIVYGGLLNQTANDFVVASGNGRGTVNLYGGVLSNSNGSVAIGNGSGGIGALVMTNGILCSKNYLYVGNPAGSFGTLNLTNGSVTATTLFVGESGTGTVNQTGGAIAVIGAGDPAFSLGHLVAASVGTYTLSGGVLGLTGTGNFQVGGYGKGSFTQVGGVVTGNSWMVIGRYASGSGTATLAGGTFNQTGAGYKLIVGEAGLGTLIITNAGFANLVGGMSIGHAGGTGTVTLATGGLILTPIVYQPGTGNSRSFFNFDGGTLRARGSGVTIANFLQGLTLASVKAGGAVIDSSSNLITVAQSLASGANPDGGLTKLGTGTLTLAGTNSYNGATTISNGVLRLGVANAITNIGAIRVVGGTFDLGGFSVTNGAVTLDNGSIINGTLNATSYELTGSGSVYARLVGGASLTKSGSGSAVLFGANAYVGETRINAGTLRVSASPASLAHRWSFNGDMNDSAGGRTALRYGTTTPTLSSTQVTLAGGGKGTSWVDLGANILPTNNVPVTIELWATQNVVQNWARIFDFGSGTANNLLMSWTQGTAINSDQLRFVTPSGDASINNTLNPYTLGTQFHIAVVIKPNGSGSTITAYKMDAGGSVLATGSFNDNSSLANLIQNNMWLGHSEYNDSDASASYNEVRIWNVALTQAQLADNSLLGPDALPAGAGGDGLPSGTQVSLAANATLDLNGNSQTVTGLSGSGLVTNGTLTVNNGTIAPGGTNVIGTLTLAATTELSGTLLVDVALDGTSDLLKVQGSLNLTGLALQIQDVSKLKPNRQYVIATCAPGGLTGRFVSTNLDGSRWLVSYNNTTGEVRLISRGLLIMIR